MRTNPLFVLAGPAFLSSAGFATFLLILLLTWPALPISPPTLAGVQPARLTSTVPWSSYKLATGSLGVPEGWSSKDKEIGLGRDFARVDVFIWRVAPGIPLDTPEARRRAVQLDMRIQHTQLSTPREITLAGKPGLEIAGAPAHGGDWVLVTYGFVNELALRITCRANGYKKYGGPLSSRTGPNWDGVLPGCAAAVASFKVNG